ncbi:MAG: chlorophyll synthase ChlG [Gemmatimonadales bacterium]|jgi:chlorophyll synthase|nr:chlorophyll synthase ChlG [Gemmatimonadales bacterium]
MTAVSPALSSGRRPVPHPRDVLALLKPVTWFPPMWAFLCGAVSVGVPFSGRGRVLAMGLVLTGPLVMAASQAANDWFDRDVDALNEPDRPIPSGRIPGRWGLALALGWSLLSVLAAASLGRWGFVATLLALAIGWAYSAPPLRFKRNAWIGNLACGISYETLAWVTGAAVLLGGTLPGPRTLLVALLYGLGAHGMLTLNDYKSIAGDQRMGVRSLPVQLGPRRAAIVAGATIVLPQLLLVALLFAWGSPVAASVVAALAVIQLAMLAEFVAHPVERALWYSALGVPFSVLGMMAAALALRTMA